MTIETKTRSFVKSILWRIVAVANSYFILKMGFSQEALINAITMNISGFVFYYVFERICDKVRIGKYNEN